MPRRKSTLTFPVPSKREAWHQHRYYYVTADGRIVRHLVWESYEPCVTFGGFPRTYQMRIPADDPRPLGRRVSCGKYWTDPDVVCRIADHDIQHQEIGVWYVTDHNQPEPRVIAGLLTENGVSREDAA